MGEIGVGMLGYAFMGKAHSNALKKIAYMTWPPPLVPRLVGIAGRNEEAVGEAARALRLRVRHDRLARARRRRPHRPLRQRRPELAARRADDRRRGGRQARRSARSRSAATPPRATRSGGAWPRPASSTSARSTTASCPAVRLAREMIEAGELGEIRHFRGRYLQDWGDDPSLDTWRFQPDAAGSGALGDLGAHVIDLARYLNGEIASVAGLVKTFLPGRQVDDAIEAAVEFENGSVGTIESTRLALGRRNALQWEINGSKGSLAFDMERLNELQVFRDDGDRARGFKTVLVSEGNHPFWEHWWPPGHIIGWGETFVHELHHLLKAIADDTDVAPYGATFEDGYRAAEVCDAIVRSSGSGAREQLSYRVALGSENDFERRAAARRRAEREPALDRLGARAHVLQALAGFGFLAVEAVAVVGDGDEPLPERALADRHLGPRRVRMLADVREPLLDDAEDLDLLVGREADRPVDLELDLEPAVGRQHVDVAAERGVERSSAARGREREDREARLLLREDRRLLDPRSALLDRRAAPRASTRASRRRTGTAPGRRGSRVRPVRARRRPRARTRRTGSRARRRSGRRRTRACAGSRPATTSELASSGWKTRCSAAKSMSVKPSASQRARSSPRRTKRIPQPTTATSVTSAWSASVPVR